MKMMKRFLIPLLLCATATVFADLVDVPTPEDLAKKADIICDGIPLKIVRTDERVVMHKVPMRVAVATIKVTAKVKGNMPDQIEFRFRQVVFANNVSNIAYPQLQVQLLPGNRYRFFLKKDAKGNYVGILDDDFDDGFAVVPIDDKGNAIVP